MQPNLSPDAVLAAMRAQYQNQAAFHAAAQVGLGPLGDHAAAAVAAGLGGPAAATLGRVGGPGLGMPNLMAPGAPPGLSGLLQQPVPAQVAGAGPLGGVAPLGGMGAGSSSSTAEAPHKEASRIQQLREKAKKEAESKEEGERLRCHLHKKHNNSCKFCQRHKDFVDKGKEEKAALREKFINDMRRREGGGRDEDATSKERGRGVGSMELQNTKTYGFPPLLQSHIVESAHFKTLMGMESFEQVVEELYRFADSHEPYTSHSATTPSCLFCCVYRLFAMGIESRMLRQLMENNDSPYIRCAGFLYVRYGLSPDSYWSWMGEYVLDDEDPPGWNSTIGDFVEMLLSQDRYFSTVLPRLPVSTKRHIETKLAQVPQYRKRTQANHKILHEFRQKGVRVEACPNDQDWLTGETVALVDDNVHRIKVRIKFDATGDEGLVHIGKVIITDSRVSGKRSRSPTGGTDWSREKGRSTADLLDELRSRDREKAVCTSGKEKARRPVSFQVALPMDQGSASYSLIREETFVTATKPPRDARSRSPVQDRKKEPSAEHQARMKQLFEKYGTQKSVGDDSSRKKTEVEGPDVMRLG